MDCEGAVPLGRCQGCKGSLEERVVRHCAPTLAGIKCGSMFRMCGSPAEVLHGIRSLNGLLQSCGVSLMVLRSEADAMMVYVYRPEMLSEVVSDMRVRGFLGGFGYFGRSYASYLQRLSVRFGEVRMPHEVGVFLGYPLEDVMGFMANGGRCSACSGCWKSYSDPEEAECRFRRCRECSDRCMRMYLDGMPITAMSSIQARVLS